MFKGEKQIKTESIRKSKLGNKHKCTRIKTIYLFQCDSCGKDFERAKGKIERKDFLTFINTCATHAIQRNLLNNKVSNKDKFLEWTHQATHL